MAQDYIVIDFCSGKTDEFALCMACETDSKICGSRVDVPTLVLFDLVDEQSIEENIAATLRNSIAEHLAKYKAQIDDTCERNLKKLIDEMDDCWRALENVSSDIEKKISEVIDSPFDSFRDPLEKSYRNLFDCPHNVSEPYKNYYDSFSQFIWKNQFISMMIEAGQVMESLVDLKNRNSETHNDVIPLAIFYSKWGHRLAITGRRAFNYYWNLIHDFLGEIKPSRKMFPIRIEPKAYSGKLRNPTLIDEYVHCKLNNAEMRNPISGTKKLCVYPAEKSDSGMNEKLCMRIAA